MHTWHTEGDVSSMLRRAARSVLPRALPHARRLTSSLVSPTVPTAAAGRHAELTRLVTSALAPRDESPAPSPSEGLVEDLDALYDTLMSPLPEPPTREDRHDALLAVDTTPEIFWSSREPSEESFDLLIRACGMQGELAKAHAAFDAMADAGVPVSGRLFSALMDACARAGDDVAAKATLTRMLASGLPPSAPVFTGLVGALRRAGRPAQEAHAVLERARRHNCVEDAPLHTAIMQAYLDAGEPDAAWDVFNEMRMVRVKADSVAFTAMLTACAMQDQLEQAQALLRDMELDEVAPTVATHAAYIRCCAARCASLAELPKSRRRELAMLAVDSSPQTPLRLAEERLALLEERGHRADGHVYRALLAACAGAADVPRAQRYLTRMLDARVPPRAAHFDELLRACARAQDHAPTTEMGGAYHEECLRVAATVPTSMEALGLQVTPRTLDLVLGAYTAGRRIHRSVDLLHTLYARHGLSPGAGAFRRMLGLSCRVRSPALAEQLLAQMRALGVAATDEQLQIPARIDHRRRLRDAAKERRRLQPPSEFSLLPSTTRAAAPAVGRPRGRDRTGGLGAGSSPARRPALPRSSS